MGNSIILNGDFEQCEEPNKCPDLNNLEGGFNYVSDWEGYGFLGDPGLSTPDIAAEYNLTNHYAGIYNSEGVYQNLSSRIRGVAYKLKYSYSFGIDLNDGYGAGTGMEVWGTNIAPSQLGCMSLAGGTKQLLDKVIFDANIHSFGGVFYNRSLFINAIDGWSYLTFKPHYKQQCGEYMYLDNVSLENYCCADYILYHNYNRSNNKTVPRITQRVDYIKAGYEAGIPHTTRTAGNVIIQDTQNVIFQAKAVYLEPGFVVEPGAVFSAQVGGCELISNNVERDYKITLDWKNNAAIFKCIHDEPEFAFSFFSTNATYYRVSVFDRWGQRIYKKEDFIHWIPTVSWDGSGVNPNIPREAGDMLMLLELYNCVTGASLTKGYTIFYAYDGCNPNYSFKMEELSEDQLNDATNNYEKQKIILFPNPAIDNITISAKLDKDIPVLIKIFDQQGRLVKEITNLQYEPYYSKFEQNIALHDFPVGIYMLQLVTNNNSYTQSFIKK